MTDTRTPGFSVPVHFSPGVCPHGFTAPPIEGTRFMAEQPNSRHAKPQTGVSEEAVRAESEPNAGEPMEPHERLLSDTAPLPAAERSDTTLPPEVDDFEFVIEDDEPLVGDPPAPDDAGHNEPSFDTWLRSSDSARDGAESPESDSAATAKRPTFVSGADELAQMSEGSDSPDDGIAPRRPQLEDLTGVTEPENVVGGDDLMQQLDALEDFDTSEPDGFDASSDFESIEDDFVEEPFSLPHDAEDPLNSVHTSTATRPSRTRPISLPLAAALLLVITAGVYFTWFHQPPKLDESTQAKAPGTTTETAAASDAATDTPPKASETLTIFADEDPGQRRVTTRTGSSIAEADLIADFDDEAGDERGDENSIEHLIGETESAETVTENPSDSGPRTLIAAAATPPSNKASDEAMQKYEDTPLKPDEIIIALKNGNTFQGRLKKTTDEGIVLFFENGEITLPREILDEILPEDSEEYLPAESFPDGFVEFEHGNRMYGKILYVTTTRVVMDVAGARFIFPRSSVDVDYQHPVFVRSDLQ